MRRAILAAALAARAISAQTADAPAATLVHAVLTPGVEVPEAWRGGWPDAVHATVDGAAAQAELVRGADGAVERIELWWLDDGSAPRRAVRFEPGAAASAWRVTAAPVEVRANGEALLRFVDDWDPARREETYKAFHHVLGADREPITKGPGGDYSHHRGLFLGWNATGAGNRRLDFWHCGDGSALRGRGVEVLAAGPVFAAHRATIDWLDPEDEQIVRETRLVRTWRMGPGVVVHDFDIDLRTALERVTLDGDPQHAGFQFRAAQEVHDRPDATRYLRPAEATGGADDVWRDCRWACCRFSVRGDDYAVAHLDHPANPPAVYSTRAYGRFGAFPRGELTPDRPLRLRYRIVVASGAAAAVDAAECERWYRAWAWPPSPAIEAAR